MARGDATGECLSFAHRQLNAKAIAKVLGWSALSRLSHLSLQGVPLATPELRALGMCEHLSALHYLDLRGNQAKKPPFAQLAWAPALQDLDTLVLSNVATDDDVVRFGDAELAQLLGVLAAPRSSLTAQRFAPMLDAEAPALEELNLRDTPGVTVDFLEQLGSSKLLANMKKLDIGGETDLRKDAIERVPEHVQRAMRAARWPR